MLGRADRHERELDLGPAQPLGRGGADIALFQLDRRAHGRQGLKVQVDRPRPDGAAARQGHLGVPRARQQRPQHVERGPHLTHQIIGGKGRGQLRRMEQGLLPVGAVTLGHLHAELAQQLAQESRVRQTRHVRQQQGLIRQNRRRHQLDRRILGPADRNGAVEAIAAVNDDAVHGCRGSPGRPGPLRPGEPVI